ncbi:MAG: hypothetical protein ACYC26_16895 [Phycisphaerales bacterium]
MEHSTDTFESLAGRHLDGELTADEQAEFYRLIMRDPRKRARAEQARDLDRAAGRAIHAVLGSPSRSMVTPPLSRRNTHRWLRAQWLATAALLLLAAGAWQLLAMEKQAARMRAANAAMKQQVMRVDAAAHASVPKTQAPRPEVTAAFSGGEDAALTLAPPVLPEPNASISTAATVSEMWWRKPRVPLLANPTTRSASATTQPAKHEDHPHSWATLLNAMDPTGKRYGRSMPMPPAPAATPTPVPGSAPAPTSQPPVVNSVSGEL